MKHFRSVPDCIALALLSSVVAGCHDSSLVGQWQSKCSTIFNDGKKCQSGDWTDITFYPDGQYKETYWNANAPITYDGSWTSFWSKVTILRNRYYVSGNFVESKSALEWKYQVEDSSLSVGGIKAERILRRQIVSEKDYDSTGFAKVSRFEIPVADPYGDLVRINEIEK